MSALRCTYPRHICLPICTSVRVEHPSRALVQCRRSLPVPCAVPDLPSKGLIERKLAERRKRQAQQPPPRSEVDDEPGGPALVSLPEGSSSDMVAVEELERLMPSLRLREKMRQGYIDIDISFPGLRVLHVDPPVFIVEDFMTAQQCDELTAMAAGSGLMVQRSAVGSDNLASSLNSPASDRRTSTSLLVDDGVASSCPGIATAIQDVQERAKSLIKTDMWYPAGQLPPPDKMCFESPQLARYNQGQFFLAHEDAFPVSIAKKNRFQRAATLLLYLNDVAYGGRTQFEHLGIAVPPKKGRALLFFPAFADGRPDPRTLHTAMDAQDEKWVSQIWIARGWSSDTKAGTPTAEPFASALRQQSTSTRLFPGVEGIHDTPRRTSMSGLVYTEPAKEKTEKTGAGIMADNSRKAGRKSKKKKDKRRGKPNAPGGRGFA